MGLDVGARLVGLGVGGDVGLAVGGVVMGLDVGEELVGLDVGLNDGNLVGDDMQGPTSLQAAVQSPLP